MVVGSGGVTVAAGPLVADDAPRHVLEVHANPHHNPSALLDMRKAPQNYAREYTTDAQRNAVAVSPM